MTSDPEVTPGRRRVVAIACAFVAVVALVLLVVGLSGSDEPDQAGDESAESPIADPSAAPTSNATDQTTTTGPGASRPPGEDIPTPADESSSPASTTQEPTSSTSPATEGEPTSSTSTTTEPPQPPLPTTPLERTSERARCTSIMSRLREYRDLAAKEPLTSLLTLQLGLEEFEHEIDFLAEGHDWGLSMIEEIVQVRRDWSTAYSAYFADDTETAAGRSASALQHLDAALAVPCPEE